MGNKYHDAEGKFSSRNEMRKAINQAAKNKNYALYEQLMNDWNQIEAEKEITQQNPTSWKAYDGIPIGEHRYITEGLALKKTVALKEFDSVVLSGLLQQYAHNEYTPEEQSQVTEAISMASYLHRNDYRKGARGTTKQPPYIEHPLRVATRLFSSLQKNVPSHMLIAAVLHDTVEDHLDDYTDFVGVNFDNNANGTSKRETVYSFLEERYGAEATRIVKQLTNPLPTPNQTKEEKLAQYQEHVKKAITGEKNAAVLMIKFSDFADNAGSLHHHYKKGDPKGSYFAKRYLPLVKLYRETFAELSTKPEHQDINYENINSRLNNTEAFLKSFPTPKK